MTLATITEARHHIEQATAWLREVTQNHLPQLEAEAQHTQDSVITRALRDAALTAPEEQLVADVIAGLTALRSTAAEPAGPGAAPAAT